MYAPPATCEQLYRTRRGEEGINQGYDAALAALPFPYHQIDVQTSFGRAHVTVAGPDQAPPLMLWHGAGAPAPFMLHAAKQLAGAYRIYCPDLPCQGGSRSEPAMLDPSQHQYGEWGLEVMRALGLLRPTEPPPLHLGISLGGCLLLDLAIVAPQAIRCGALLVPGSLHPGYDSWRHRAVLMAQLLLPATLFRLLPTRFTSWLMLRGMMDEPEAADDPLVAHLRLVFRHVRFFPPGPGRVEAAQLRGCTAPMLVIAAERDIFGGGAATAERARQVLPNCTAEVVPGARHVLSRAKFVGVIERILEFFRQHCPLDNSASS